MIKRGLLSEVSENIADSCVINSNELLIGERALLARGTHFVVCWATVNVSVDSIDLTPPQEGNKPKVSNWLGVYQMSPASTNDYNT